MDSDVVISEGPLSVDDAIARVKHAGAGAVVVMIGCVRDHTSHDGAHVTVHRLQYEAYADMAKKVIDDHRRTIEKEHDDARIAVAHRVGDLAVGDLAVVVAASSARRATAFAACRDMIERLKQDAPIWKREHGDDGVVWVGMGP